MTTTPQHRFGALADYWYAAARAEEVTPRRPIGRTVLGELVCLWRGPDGPVAHVDRCLHRNAALSEGELFDGCIGCPYHGWTYDPQGRVVAVPSEGAGPPSVAGARLRTFPVRQQDGLVWVWMGEGAPDKEPFRMPHWGDAGWGTYYMTTHFTNGVTNLVENFMDVPHTVFVHRGWFRNRARRRVAATVERTPDSVLVTYEQPNDSIGVSGRILNPRGAPTVHTDRFYMPNNTRVDYVFGDLERGGRSFIITSTCTPISEMETTVYTLISYKLGWLNPLGRLLLPFYTRQVIEQDVDIMRNQGRVLRHYGEPRFASTAADTLHLHIEALREHALAGAVGAAPAPVVDAIEFWI